MNENELGKGGVEMGRGSPGGGTACPETGKALLTKRLKEAQDG